MIVPLPIIAAVALFGAGYLVGALLNNPDRWP